MSLKKQLSLNLKTGRLLSHVFVFLLGTQVYAGVGSNELKIGVSQEFENLNPLITTMAVTTFIQEATIRRLITMNADGKWIPVLAKEIPTLENGLAKFIEMNGKKKLTATWEIKQEASWGDGVPVTGNDIVFSWIVARNKNISINSRDIWDNMEAIAVDKTNPKKFTITYVEPRWDFNTNLANFNFIPKHLEEQVFNKYKNQPAGYEKNSLYTTQPTNKGLYNAPYIVKEIKLGSHVTLAVNPKYFDKKPLIPLITFKLIPNTGTLEANLRAKSIDMISNTGLSFDQALSLEKKIQADHLPYEVLFRQGLVYEHIDLQMKNDILKDLKVRQALVYGINRDDLTNALFEGRQKKAIHNTAPIDPWYTEDPQKIMVYPFSRRKAQALLDEAGWKKGPDGYRYKDGKKLSLQLMTTAGNKTRELVETYLQDQWKNIGVEITVKNEPARVFFGETIRKGKYPSMAMYAWISTPETTSKANLATDQIPTEKNAYSGQNSGGYSNVEMDQLLKQLDTEFDGKKRLDIVSKILYLYTRDVPAIPLYYQSETSVVPKTLKGYRLTGTLIPPTWEVENWEFTPAVVN